MGTPPPPGPQRFFTYSLVFCVFVGLSLICSLPSYATSNPATSNFQITLAGRSFTPEPGISSDLALHVEKLLELPETERSGQPVPVIVQFKASLSADEQKMLREAGLTLYDQVGQTAYLGALGPEQFAEVKTHPRLRWMGFYKPGDKLSGKFKPGSFQTVIIEFLGKPSEAYWTDLWRIEGVTPLAQEDTESSIVAAIVAAVEADTLSRLTQLWWVKGLKVAEGRPTGELPEEASPPRKRAPPAPPPFLQVRAIDGRLFVEARNVEARAVFAEVDRKSGVKINVDPLIRDRLTLHLSGTTIERGLKILIRAPGSQDHSIVFKRLPKSKKNQKFAIEEINVYKLARGEVHVSEQSLQNLSTASEFGNSNSKPSAIRMTGGTPDFDLRQLVRERTGIEWQLITTKQVAGITIVN